TSALFDMQFRPMSIGRPELKKLLTAGVEPGVEQQSSYRIKESRREEKIRYEKGERADRANERWGYFQGG
ncbi:MAG: hypothetical protein ACYSYU_11285, partial [Planctomycetota bacterium]